MKPGIDYIGVGVGVFIVNGKNELLLLLRKKAPEKGTWMIPGGAIEFGEKIEDTVKREAREELGIGVEIIRHLNTGNHIIVDEGKKTHWVAPVFLCRIVSGEPKILEPEKHADIGWFPLGKLPGNLSKKTALDVGAYLKNG